MHFCLPVSTVDTDRIYSCLKSVSPRVRTGSEGTFCPLYLHKQSNQKVHSRSLFNLAVLRREGIAQIVSSFLFCWLSRHFISQLSLRDATDKQGRTLTFELVMNSSKFTIKPGLPGQYSNRPLLQSFVQGHNWPI